jgi:uncharacterized membrane protein
MPISIPKWFNLTLLATAFVGFVDATYLTVNNWYLGSTPCTLTEGCEIVTSSVYSTIAGVPISAIGLGFYLVAIILVLFYILEGIKRALDILFYLSIVAFLVSLALVAIQIFIIEAFCLYCMISALTSTIIFLMSLFYWFNLR